MRILFVAPYVPSPIRVRPFQWIRTLSRLGQQVRLVALQPPEDAWLEHIPVRDCCESITTFPLTRTRTLLNALGALPQDLPLQAAYSLHAEAERFIADQASDCDVVHVEHLRGALLTRRVRGIPQVIDAVDSISGLFEQTKTQAPSWRHRLMARADLARTRKFEAGITRRFDLTLVSSSHDASAFQRLGGTLAAERVVALPNGVDLDYFKPQDGLRDASTILFTGKMSYHANEAAALRLVHHIMPLVWRRRADARVIVAGKDPSPFVREMARDSRVTVTGFVEDLRPFLSAATLVMAPLTYGTGIQNKVLEAMACGTPVVASPKACQGIAAVSGRDLLIGDNDRELAELALDLIDRSELRQRLGAEGRRYVTTHHDWSEMGRRLVAAYEGVRTRGRRCA
jgi:glycosyltransferase involved in cell wall biosynthesis